MDAADTPFPGRFQEAASLCQRILSKVPTVIGKLIWASSCRLPGSNQYGHPALDQMFSPEIAGQVLEESHRHCFEQWLGMGLQERHDDFVKYLDTLPLAGRPREFLRDLGGRLLPPSAARPEQCRFDTDLAVVLALLA